MSGSMRERDTQCHSVVWVMNRERTAIRVCLGLRVDVCELFCEAILAWN